MLLWYNAFRKQKDCEAVSVKEKITEQSIRLFEKKGFSETSIQDIVDSLGVTKGTFYYYFSGSNSLIFGNNHIRVVNLKFFSTWIFQFNIQLFEILFKCVKIYSVSSKFLPQFQTRLKTGL